MTLAAAGCTASALDRHFEAGQFELAARAYEEDPSVAGSDRALYRLALSYASPGTAVSSPERARAVLAQLVARFPQSPHLPEARILAGLLGTMVDLSDQAKVERQQLDSLRAVVQDLEATRAALQDTIGTNRSRLTDLQAEVTRLQGEVEAKDAVLRRLEDELRRLKNIDLGRPSN
jgi:TolA-binding protein